MARKPRPTSTSTSASEFGFEGGSRSAARARMKAIFAGNIEGNRRPRVKMTAEDLRVARQLVEDGSESYASLSQKTGIGRQRLKNGVHKMRNMERAKGLPKPPKGVVPPQLRPFIPPKGVVPPQFAPYVKQGGGGQSKEAKGGSRATGVQMEIFNVQLVDSSGGSRVVQIPARNKNEALKVGRTVKGVRSAWAA